MKTQSEEREDDLAWSLMFKCAFRTRSPEIREAFDRRVSIGVIS